MVSTENRDGRFGSKVGQIGSKWDKSGAFSDQISEPFVPFGVNLTHFGTKPTIPGLCRQGNKKNQHIVNRKEIKEVNCYKRAFILMDAFLVTAFY